MLDVLLLAPRDIAWDLFIHFDLYRSRGCASDPRVCWCGPASRGQR